MRVDQEMMDKMLSECDASKIITGKDAIIAQRKKREMDILREKENIRKKYEEKTDEEKYNDFLVIYNMVISEKQGKE